MSLIERLKLESELKSTVSIGKLFQRFMTRLAKKLDLTELLQKYLKIPKYIPILYIPHAKFLLLAFSISLIHFSCL